MGFWKILMASCFFVVFYNYLGYALIVLVLNRIKKIFSPPGKRDVQGDGLRAAELPTLSFIVAAYNEEDCIREKILNSLQQDYPAGRIEYIFITDGSTDRTPEIIREYPSIRLLHQPERNGKSAALNRAVQASRHDILVFSDANTVLNREATRLIAGHYANPRTGGVAGEKKVLPSSNTLAAAAGKQAVAGTGGVAGTTESHEVAASEGLYWKYESFLKKTDAEFYSVVGAAGELFSLRKNLFIPLPHSVILDDFVLSLKVAEKGYRFRYEPGAYAMELPSFSLQDEQKRKIRIAAGGFQSIGMLPGLLAFWRHPRLSFLYISHRVLRWVLTPFCLPLGFVANGIVVANGALADEGAPFVDRAYLFYSLLFVAQVIFYGIAVMTAFIASLKKNKLCKLIYYFIFMNVSVILGFFRFLRGSQSATWEKARRLQAQ